MIEYQGQEINPSDIVFYVLRERDKPVEPERQWKGQVTQVYYYYANVRSLENGYEEEEELIFLKQIVQVERTH